MPTTNKQKAQMHAMLGFWCSCGVCGRGNGGRSSHKRMHERRGNWEPRASIRTVNPAVHGFIDRADFRARFGHG